MRAATVTVAALAVAAGLSGCGGGTGSSTRGAAGGSPGAMHGDQMPRGMGSSPGAPATTAGPAAGEGRSLFLASGCGGCHTLAAAGTTGTVGPDLDEAHPGYELVVRWVTQGGGGMPAFADTLTGPQIRAVAHFVAGSAG